jgi:uncharacterized protein (DUF1778 family)
MGRKKMKTEEKVDIRLRVDSEFQQRVQDAADQEGNSVAAFIRTAVVEKLKRIERAIPVDLDLNHANEASMDAITRSPKTKRGGS